MAHTILRSGCKVNLTLFITGRRSDGMHELESLFWPIQEPYDTLILKPGEAGSGIRVRCSHPDVDEKQNTLIMAWQAFKKVRHEAADLQITLHKGVPSGAGLGGGSADAASLLLWLNSRMRIPLSSAELAEVALHIGADVPFFLINAPCMARGVGEQLTPLPYLADQLHGWKLLVLCPDVQVSTPWAYAAWDAAQHAASSNDLTKSQPVDSNFIPSTDSAVASGLPFCPQNAFEPVVFHRFPELAELKARLLASGAAAAVMSGSGASLCGLFAPDQTEACLKASATFQAEGLAAYINTAG